MTLEVSRNCKTTTLFFGKRTTKNTEGKDPGMPDTAMHQLHICCTMRANGSFVIHGFSAAECRKAIMGNLRNMPHLIFHELPFDNFPHSAIYPCPKCSCAPCWWGGFTGWSSGLWLWQRSIPGGGCWSTTARGCRCLFWQRWCKFTPVPARLPWHGKIQSTVSPAASVKMTWQCSLPGARSDGHGYSWTSRRLLYDTHRIIPDGDRPAIWDYPASHLGMCEMGLTGVVRPSVSDPHTSSQR